MAETFVEMLNEPKNSLGRTEEVVAIVLADPTRIDELYQCFFQSDEWVRLRTSSSFKRIWRANDELFQPYIAGFVDDVSSIDQASVNWTFAQMCLDLSEKLDPGQRLAATNRLKAYLGTSDDWIVQNTTIETLGTWAQTDHNLADWLLPRLGRLAGNNRSSVAKRATTWLDRLSAI